MKERDDLSFNELSSSYHQPALHEKVESHLVTKVQRLNSNDDQLENKNKTLVYNENVTQSMEKRILGQHSFQHQDSSLIETKSTLESQQQKAPEFQSFDSVVQNKNQFQFFCMPPVKSTKQAQKGQNSRENESKPQPSIDQNILETILANQAYCMKDFQLKQILKLNKIGLVGIPCLWMSRQELINSNYIGKSQLDEEERLKRIYKLLRIHKKWETDKYLAASYKRGTSLAEKMLKDVENGSQEAVLPHLRNQDSPDIMLYRIMQSEARLVKLVLEAHGFQQTESNDWNIMWTCNQMNSKGHIFETLNESQKVNHFVNSTELTRKDRYSYNVSKMGQKHGKENFNFCPETFVLPEEFNEFYKTFQQAQLLCKENPGRKNLWIAKPYASSQGKGIFIIDDVNEVPMNESLVLSKYIDNPLLINGLKFDMRIYVLVTNVEPLRIYIYNEGLVRFASELYNIDTVKSNVYAHLTNYSINKKSENFVQNKKASERDFGNKWSISALSYHLSKMGINMEMVWDKIYDAILKSFISIENHVYQAFKKNQNTSNPSYRCNSFDLFGFDIILDSDLKPWILEVNLSPSLAFDSPLDYQLKSNLIIDALNIVGLRKFVRKKEALGKSIKMKPTAISNNQIQNKIDKKKRYPSALNMMKDQNDKSQSFNKTDNQANQTIVGKDQYEYEGVDVAYLEKLSKISVKHRDIVKDVLDEFHRNNKKNFTRIYPAPGSNFYDQFFEQTRHINKMVYKLLYQTSEISEVLSNIYQDERIAAMEQARLAKTQAIKQVQQQAISTNNSPLKTDMIEINNHTSTTHFSPEKSGGRSSSFSNMSSLKKYDQNQTLSPKRTQEEIIESKKVSLKEREREKSPKPTTTSPEEKVVITGDDILIEYVKRLTQAIKSCSLDLNKVYQQRVDSFLNHKVWSSKSQSSQVSISDGILLWQKLDLKACEMYERKKRIFIRQANDQGQINRLRNEQKFKEQEGQKQEIIKGFTSSELEKMLLQSNQNNQLDVVGILVNNNEGLNGGGLLTKIERENRKNNRQLSTVHRNQQQLDTSIHKQEMQPYQEFVTPKGSTKANSLSQKQRTDSKINTYNSSFGSSNDEQLNQTNGNQQNLSNYNKGSPYFSSQPSKSNLHPSSKKQTNSDREIIVQQSIENKLILPQIKLSNAGPEFSRASRQQQESGEVINKYRNRMINDNYMNKRVRGTSISNNADGKKFAQ